VPTKSGLMVGLGETDDEILQVMRDMRAHGIDMLTIGQYLRRAATTCRCAATCTRTPSDVRARGAAMGFTHAAVGAMVRSSYHADQQAEAAGWRRPKGDRHAAQNRSLGGPRGLPVAHGGCRRLTAAAITEATPRSASARHWSVARSRRSAARPQRRLPEQSESPDRIARVLERSGEKVLKFTASSAGSMNSSLR
jgi:hypothetical protein